jgi:TrmH family RNA methyltransferase
MAYGAQDTLKSAQVYPTLLAATQNTRFLVGLTGHTFRRYETPMPLPEIAPEVIAWGRRHPVALLFGSEGTGLTTEEIALCHRLVTIPTPGPHASLNLSQAVIVVLYELIRGIPETTVPVPENPASVAEMEHLYQAWSELLTRSRIIRERQGESMLTRIRRIFSRSSLSPEEARMIQGIARQVVWQLEHPKEVREDDKA